MQLDQLRRRELIALLGGVAATWPLVARAQQGERMPRIGVLSNLTEDDPEARARDAAFVQGLRRLDWIAGRNVQIEYRYAAADPARFRSFAAELAGLRPNVVLAYTSPAVVALQQAMPSVPIVFASVIDPVGAGIVETLAPTRRQRHRLYGVRIRHCREMVGAAERDCPGGDAGCHHSRSRHPCRNRPVCRYPVVAPSLAIEFSAIGVRDPSEIERGVATFSRSANGGLIVTASVLATAHRRLIIEIAARYRLPALYPFRYYVTGDGLMSYGPDQVDQFRRAAAYVDRILKGEKPADLPVQAPTKYELVINLKTAKALGLDVPSSLLARADEVIE